MLMLDLNALEVQSFTTTEETVVESWGYSKSEVPMCTCVSCTDRPPDCTESIDRACDYTLAADLCKTDGDATKIC